MHCNVINPALTSRTLWRQTSKRAGDSHQEGTRFARLPEFSEKITVIFSTITKKGHWYIQADRSFYRYIYVPLKIGKILYITDVGLYSFSIFLNRLFAVSVLKHLNQFRLSFVSSVVHSTYCYCLQQENTRKALVGRLGLVYRCDVTDACRDGCNGEKNKCFCTKANEPHLSF